MSINVGPEHACAHGHKPGDTVVITGDTMGWGHGVSPGETRTLRSRFFEGDGVPAHEGWETEDHWAIGCADMIDAKVAEEDVQAAIESIMKVNT